MRKLYFVFFIVLAVFIVSDFLIAQDDIPKPIDPNPEKTDNDKKEDSDKKDKKLYDLNLIFKKDMKFKESAVVKIAMNVDFAGTPIEQTINSTTIVSYEILEVKDYKIKKAKLVFDKVDVKVNQNGMESDSSKPGGFHCIATFDDDGVMKFESTSADFPEDLKTYMEQQDFIGYHPPAKGVAIGEEWKVDPKFMKAQLEQYGISKVETKMKLEKVTTPDKKANKAEVATLKITTSFEGSDANSGLEMKGKAEGTILLDITNHRLLTRKITLKITGEAEENGEKILLNGSIVMDDKFSYGDQLQTRKNDKEDEVKPKDDEE